MRQVAFRYFQTKSRVAHLRDIKRKTVLRILFYQLTTTFTSAGIPFLGEFYSAKASYDALVSSVDWTGKLHTHLTFRHSLDFYTMCTEVVHTCHCSTVAHFCIRQEQVLSGTAYMHASRVMDALQHILTLHDLSHTCLTSHWCHSCLT